ncbi:hypothetical protein Q9966_014378 [Columba livia]|nr:hypothetical protein Q9966_014378 [Columba livia]
MASPDEQEAAGPQAVGGLLPENWAELFQNQEHLLDPVLPWLRQQLEAIYGSRWWLARSAESTILHALCICGLDGDAMVQMMQDYLEEHTEELVHGVISIIRHRTIKTLTETSKILWGEKTQSLFHSSSSLEKFCLQNDKIGSKNYMRMKSQDSVSLVPLGTLLKGDFSAAGGENATVEETKKTELHMSVEWMVLHIDLRAPETSKQLPIIYYRGSSGVQKRRPGKNAKQASVATATGDTKETCTHNPDSKKGLMPQNFTARI